MPQPPRARPMAASLGALAALLLLAGCDQPDAFPPACPSLARAKEFAEAIRFAGSGRDVTDMVLSARIAEVPAQCKRENSRAVRATLRVGVDITRGPAAAGRSAELGYFVAVTEGDRVLEEQDYTIRGTFPPNVDKVSVLGQEISLIFPVTSDKPASAYKIYVAFRLTPAELDYNRRRGLR